MEEIVIRTMKMEDYDRVRRLWMSIRGFGIRSIDDSREDVERFLKRNPTTSCVAVAPSGRIVGSILCGNDGRQGSFYHVCVEKKFRRRGIGSQMAIFCMNALKELKINKVTLIAFTRNDAGNAFWKSVGWNGRSDVNYYEFGLNDENITRFIESEGDPDDNIIIKDSGGNDEEN